jgi:glycosyltransferase involved in cell wall biosynthesis
MTKKICILTDSLSSGGAEKIAANMSISLSKKGYRVYIVSMQNNIDYFYEAELYNFGLVKQVFTPFTAFLKFRKFFRQHRFDAVIDHRVRNKFFKELIFSKFIFRKCRVIYCIHSFKLEYYFSFLSLPRLAVFPHVKNRLFVSVCNNIRNYLEQKLKIKSKTIYNFISVNNVLTLVDENQFSKQHYILGVGSLIRIKQFDKLITSYHASKLEERGIKLIVLGDGPEKENLETLVLKLQIEDFVTILPFTKKPYDLISNAKALILTSKVEGFPMVLLEALSLKTPVIAFDCKSGPSEIIFNGRNGLLVEDQNEEQLTLALNKLLLDDTFYNKLKGNVSLGLERFSEKVIIQEWIKLLESEM